jgi:hypothetical protein
VHANGYAGVLPAEILMDGVIRKPRERILASGVQDFRFVRFREREDFPGNCLEIGLLKKRVSIQCDTPLSPKFFGTAGLRVACAGRRTVRLLLLQNIGSEPVSIR